MFWLYCFEGLYDIQTVVSVRLFYYAEGSIRRGLLVVNILAFNSDDDLDVEDEVNPDDNDPDDDVEPDNDPY